ncbi:MAG TPA: DUF4331 family protein [Oligoflexus sp.]|uniref:DUF4331 family protein n=1 Tax=Oligoflexus sp. TaxID=1971216 RepID=UPI002D3BB9CE|nr:DUF4331 family protein [Oligoflexus sp.]HYX32413.1 DUF4331 family protein [Oligoflexus sp.]
MSDHGSGPRALTDSTVDITDMFVFPSPEQSGALVLILNVFPLAGPTAHFSDVVDYRFRIRPVKVPSPGTGTSFAVSEKEYIFSCRFGIPREGTGGTQHMQEGTCTAPNGQTVSFRVNDDEGSSGKGFRTFVGRRMDPFFFDGPAVIQSFAARKLEFKSTGNNTMYRQNVLSIIIEFEVSTMFAAGDGPLFAIVGETVIAGRPMIRLERFGRADIKNVVLFPKDADPVNRDLEIRDLFNQEDAFKLGAAYLGAFRSRMNANLAVWDNIDGTIDWPLDPRGTHPLTELLLADFMVVDISKPFAEDSYFEIEQAVLKGTSHKTCGGRAPNDDCMETFMTIMINAGHGPRISDGIDKPAVPATRIFPYLVPPEPNPPIPKLPKIDTTKAEAIDGT